MEDTDQQKRLTEILNPKPVRPVGFFANTDGEEMFVFDNKKANKPEAGSTIYKLKAKAPIF